MSKVELKKSLLAITERCAALTDQDLRSPDEILGYDSNGLPFDLAHLSDLKSKKSE